jgi:TonB-linked SusC/RagA family outer membrane protein
MKKNLTSPSRRAGKITIVISVLLWLICTQKIHAQEKTMTIIGVVLDSAGHKLESANVVFGSGRGGGTSTDVNGRFVIDAALGDSLLISYTGFANYILRIEPFKVQYTIALKALGNVADDVVVVAYGKKQRKEAVVGSVTSIRPGDLKIPASNLTTALAGQAAGIIAYQRSGQPGQDNASFFIRGVTTFGYKKDPLILIDNVELTTNDLARLQVDDIASFSILKDASATALYGARGANGVILVTTKEGKVGKPKINIRLENSSSQSARTLELADPLTYMSLYNEATVSRTPNQPLPFNPDKIAGTKAVIDQEQGSNKYAYPAVDWLNLLFRKRTSTQRGDLSVSGGGGVARYYVAGSYNVDNGILQRDKANNNNNNVKFQNYQLRSNININLTRSTEMVLRLSGNFSEYNGPLTADGTFSTDLYNIAIHTSPVLFPAFYEPDSANQKTQHILFGNAGTNNSVTFNNPYALMLRGHKNSSESRMSAQVELNQKLSGIIPGLNFHAIFNTNRYSYFESSAAYNPFYYNIGSYDKKNDIYTLAWLNPAPGAATEYLGYYPGKTYINTFVYMQGALDYNTKIGDNDLSASLVGTRQQRVYANAETLVNSLPYRNLGLAGRATYAFKRKYFLEFNFGYNGSERFSEKHRYGFFPTIGASYVLSGEPYWESLLNVFSRAKLRISHGLVGNDAIGSQRFFYISDVNLNGDKDGYTRASFGTNGGYSRNGVVINNYPNEDITWETSRQTNLALELTVLKNINIVAEVYQNHRYNILQQRSYIPTTAGLEAPMSANLGQADSKGIDLSLDYKQNFRNSLWASVRGNLTLATSKYTVYEEPSYPEPWRYTTGQPLNRGYGFVAERLFVDDVEVRSSPRQIFSSTSAAPRGGDLKYRDMNNDGKIDVLDMVYLGYPQVPEVVYGFGFSAGFKNFDLSGFFQGQARVSFFMNPNKISPFIPSPDTWVYGNTQVLKSFADDHWSDDNHNLYALYPRMGTTTNNINNNLQQSTWWLRNGAFMRLKSVEVGYTIPRKILQNLKIENIRLYFNGMNLLTWSSFKLWDPELGGDGFNYPIQKVFNVGLNVNF